MKINQAFITEVNFLKKIDSLIDDIENFEVDDVVKTGAMTVLGKVIRSDDDSEQSKKEHENEILTSLQKVVKSKKTIRINGVMIDIFAAVVLMLILKRLPPMKREILLTLPMKQVLKYAIKNIDKIFVKF